MSRALLLVGHGSHLNADSSAPVYAHAERLRELGAFDEVVEVFWKEEPSLRDALDLIASDEVFVVPLFLAEGYFTRQVLPRELGLAGPVTRRNGQTIRYLPPVGTHPAMADLIARRALETSPPESGRHPALVVIGHGTDRSATSGDTVYALVKRLRDVGHFASVSCGFLDEEPRIGSVLQGVPAPEIVLVPFFVAEGWHTRETIPAELELTGEVTQWGGRTIRYTPPVGILPEVAELILEIVEDDANEPVTGQGAGAHPDRPAHRSGLGAADFASATTAVGKSVLTAARKAFFEWLSAAPPEGRTFLQTHIGIGREERSGPNEFVVRHLADRDLVQESLATIETPDQLLEIVRFDSSGNFRPLRTTRDLRRGWCFSTRDPAALWRAMSLIYPGAVTAWHRLRTDSLEVLDYDTWAARQTAMYSVVRELAPAAVQEVAASLCTGCLRTRVWPTPEESLRQLSVAPTPSPDLAVPCREPCTLFATRAREKAATEDPSGEPAHSSAARD